MSEKLDHKRAYLKEWRAKNPDKSRAIRERWRQSHREQIREKARISRGTPESKRYQQEWACQNRAKQRADKWAWASARLGTVKHRAAKLGVPYGITIADLDLPDTCSILGLPLSYGGGNRNPLSATLDRIIPAYGYVAGNVRVISHLANSCRQDCLSAEIFEALAADARRLFGE